MKAVFSDKYEIHREEILSFIENFNTQGEKFGSGDRNQIKIFKLNSEKINIKAFKVPNSINKIAYKFFRKSKAERSYKYANLLISKKIGTPFPIGYVEKNNIFGFGESFYISEHLTYDLTFRELTKIPHYPQKEEILRAFTKFTFYLHEQGIKFLDHSPGNTLIKVNNHDFQFFLVDLNRMEFGHMNFEERMKNFSRLTYEEELVKIMSNEYSKLSGKPEVQVYEKMGYYIQRFQEKFHQKKRLKRKLKFQKKRN